MFGSKFTLALIEHKLEEHHIKTADLRCVAPGDTVQLGCFKIEFIKVGHSIAGALALAGSMQKLWSYPRHWISCGSS